MSTDQTNNQHSAAVQKAAYLFVTLLMLLVIAIGVYVFEFVLFSKLSQQRDDTQTWNRLETIVNMRKSGVDGQPSYSPQKMLSEFSSRHGFVPLGRIGNVTTVVCNELGTPLIYDSDNYGFNNPTDIWESESVDILAIGDSNVQGWCVQPENSFIGLLRSQGHSVINLGIAGNGPLMMLASLKEYISDLSPDIVLWFHYEGNDLIELMEEKSNPILQRYLSEPEFRQRLVKQQGAINTALRNDVDYLISNIDAIEMSLKYGIKSFLSLQYVRSFLVGKAKQDKNFDLLSKVYNEASRVSKQHGSKLVTVYLPGASAARYRKNNDPARAFVRQLVHNNKDHFIDITDAFDRTGRADKMFGVNVVNPSQPAHYSIEGHAIIAESLSDPISHNLKPR